MNGESPTPQNCFNYHGRSMPKDPKLMSREDAHFLTNRIRREVNIAMKNFAKNRRLVLRSQLDEIVKEALEKHSDQLVDMMQQRRLQMEQEKAQQGRQKQRQTQTQTQTQTQKQTQTQTQTEAESETLTVTEAGCGGGFHCSADEPIEIIVCDPDENNLSLVLKRLNSINERLERIQNRIPTALTECKQVHTDIHQTLRQTQQATSTSKEAARREACGHVQRECGGHDTSLDVANDVPLSQLGIRRSMQADREEATADISGEQLHNVFDEEVLNQMSDEQLLELFEVDDELYEAQFEEEISD